MQVRYWMPGYCLSRPEFHRLAILPFAGRTGSLSKYLKYKKNRRDFSSCRRILKTDHSVKVLIFSVVLSPFSVQITLFSASWEKVMVTSASLKSPVAVMVSEAAS